MTKVNKKQLDFSDPTNFISINMVRKTLLGNFATMLMETPMPNIFCLANNKRQNDKITDIMCALIIELFVKLTKAKIITSKNSEEVSNKILKIINEK